MTGVIDSRLPRCNTVMSASCSWARNVGTDTWETNLRVLARGGTLVTCGATTGADAGLDLRGLFYKAWSILGSTMGNRGEMRTVTELLNRGRLRPSIHAALPLSELPEAHRMLEAREVLGKVVLRA